jgi:hypothetical protein
MGPSKQVIDRMRDATAVVAAAETHAVAVGEALSAKLGGSVRDGEVAPDYALVVRVLGRVLDGVRGALGDADVSHQGELADDDGPRDRRDRLVLALHKRVTVIRETLDGVFGADEIDRYGIRGETPRDGAALIAFVETMANRLAEAPLPAPRVPVTIDRNKLAVELLGLIPDVEAALETVARERREAEATLVTRNTAMDTFDATFSRTASALSALFRLAGKDELAARVRPSTRKPGRLDQPAEPAATEEARAEDASPSDEATA